MADIEAEWEAEVSLIIKRASRPASLTLRVITNEDNDLAFEAFDTLDTLLLLVRYEPASVTRAEICEALLTVIQLRVLRVPELRKAFAGEETWDWYLDQTAGWCIPMP